MRKPIFMVFQSVFLNLKQKTSLVPVPMHRNSNSLTNHVLELLFMGGKHLDSLNQLPQEKVALLNVA
jgi:hypothetical protein